MLQLMKFAGAFRMDNPLTKCGDDVYQPNEPINITVDAFGPPAAFVRGVFEYIYRADSLTLYAHVPPGITELEQKFPIRFGTKEIYISAVGKGSVTRVEVNGRRWKQHDEASISLPYDKVPERARIRIVLGQGSVVADRKSSQAKAVSMDSPPTPSASMGPLQARAAFLSRFYRSLSKAGFANTYEAAHARLALEAIAVIPVREELLATGKLKPLPEKSRQAADKAYVDTADRLFAGLERVILSYRGSGVPEKKRIVQCWQRSGMPP
jgi:hypothetical protein